MRIGQIVSENTMYVISVELSFVIFNNNESIGGTMLSDNEVCNWFLCSETKIIYRN